MDFEKLDSLRKSASIDMKLPEAHGGICSQICFDNDYFEEFVPLDQSDDGASVSVQIGAYRKALLKIIDENAKTLKDGDLDFELIIPDENYTIQERAEALSIWCQGFIDGVSFSCQNRALRLTNLKTKNHLKSLKILHKSLHWTRIRSMKRSMRN